MTIAQPNDKGTKHSKTERLEARITLEQKELFQRAADIQGWSLTDFMLVSLSDAAKRVIQEHEIMTLSARDREVFVAALLNPTDPGDKLQAAAQRFKHMGISGDTKQ